jgi:hypothetical protein
MGAAKDAAYSVREVLIAPKAVFRGVREEGESEWLCYVGIPKHSYTRDGQTRPPRNGYVFLVFVNQERVAYNWRWEQCDGREATLPQNHEERFVTRVL